MEDRNVIVRNGGGSIGTASLVALLIIAGLIALIVWQPWNGTVTLRSTTTTTQFDWYQRYAISERRQSWQTDTLNTLKHDSRKMRSMKRKIAPKPRGEHLKRNVAGDYDAARRARRIKRERSAA